MADQKPEAKKKRAPKSGKRITVTLSDEHYDAILKAAAADDREPNVYLSRIVRNKIESTGTKAETIARIEDEAQQMNAQVEAEIARRGLPPTVWGIMPKNEKG